MAFLAPVTLNLTGISPEFIVSLATQQLIYRDAKCLALDIPAGYIDGAHCGEDYAAAAHSPER